jgi:hypothetical protein
LRYICSLSNEKFKDNFERIERFSKNIIENCLQGTRVSVKSEKAKSRQEERAKKKRYFEKLKQDGNIEELRKAKKAVEVVCDFDEQVVNQDLDSALDLIF